jgi:hypothetical protein
MLCCWKLAETMGRLALYRWFNSAPSFFYPRLGLGLLSSFYRLTQSKSLQNMVFVHCWIILSQKVWQIWYLWILG